MACKVAVLGSCMTRDIFNSKFNLHYKKYFHCVLTQNQTSMISLMSMPAKHEVGKIDNLESYHVWNVRTDLNKEFLQKIVVLKPEVLVMDFFADVYFGVLQIQEGTYITNNKWKLWKTSYYKELLDKKELHLKNDPDVYMQLWKDSIDRFFQYIQPRLPTTKIIVVNAKFVNQYLSISDNKTYKISELKKDNLNVEFANEYMLRMNQYVLDQYNAICLDMTNKNYISYDEHPWGPFYVHYTMDYYRDALNRLTRLSNMEKEKMRIVVFGTGSSAEKFMSQINDEVVVQCFVDNQPARQNTLFKGIKVMAPERLPDIAYDCIVIASQYSLEIMSQLLKLGVPYEKIIPFDYVNHNRMNEKYHRATIEELTTSWSENE